MAQLGGDGHLSLSLRQGSETAWVEAALSVDHHFDLWPLVLGNKYKARLSSFGVGRDSGRRGGGRKEPF